LSCPLKGEAYEGGRETALDGEGYGCPIMRNGHGFDCRFVLLGITLFELGKTYDISVKFLNPDYALKELREDMQISLWERRTIAGGTLVKILR